MPRRPIQNLKLEIFSRLDLTSKDALRIRDARLTPQDTVKRLQMARLHSEPAERLLRFMAEYDSGFYCPEKCDVYEPIRERFDPQDLSEPIGWLSQTSGCVMMKRTKSFRYMGFVDNERFSNYWVDGNPIPEPWRGDPLFLTEWCLWLRVKLLKLKSVEEVRRFFIDLYLASEGDYGYFTMHEDQRAKNYDQHEAGPPYGQFVGYNPERGLPGVYFGNIFGKLYVDWFGRDKFESLPCFYREELPDGSYYIQVSDDLDYYRSPSTAKLAEAVIDHLGREAFFDIRDPERQCVVPDYIRGNRLGGP